MARFAGARLAIAPPGRRAGGQLGACGLQFVGQLTDLHPQLAQLVEDAADVGARRQVHAVQDASRRAGHLALHGALDAGGEAEGHGELLALHERFQPRRHLALHGVEPLPPRRLLGHGSTVPRVAAHPSTACGEVPHAVLGCAQILGWVLLEGEDHRDVGGEVLRAGGDGDAGAASAAAIRSTGMAVVALLSTMRTMSPSSAPAASAYCSARTRALAIAPARASASTASGSSYENEMPLIVRRVADEALEGVDHGPTESTSRIVAVTLVDAW